MLSRPPHQGRENHFPRLDLSKKYADGSVGKASFMIGLNDLYGLGSDLLLSRDLFLLGVFVRKKDLLVWILWLSNA